MTLGCRVAVVGALFLASCGNGDKRVATPTPEPTNEPPTLSGPPVWGKRDAPPAGVAEQAEYYGFGDQACGPPTPGATEIDIDRRPFYQAPTPPYVEGEPEIGETLSICARGFDTSRAVQLELLLPDGSSKRAELPPMEGTDEHDLKQWFLDQSWPVGRLRVRATQGSRVATRTLRVVKPRRIGARVPVSLGRQYRGMNPLPLMIVGGRPNSTALVDLYRYPGESGTKALYATTIEIPTDSSGVGQVAVPINERRDRGGYVFKPRDTGGAGQDAYADFSICFDDRCW